MAFIMTISTFSISGCGKKSYDEPELLEPKNAMVTFEKPALRELKKIDYLVGTVVPKEYPVFTTENISISNMKVKVGDYVKKGDIIAEGLMLSEEEKLNDIAESINNERSQKSISNDKIDLDIQGKRYDYDEAEVNGEYDAMEKAEMEIELCEEDRRYENELYDRTINEETKNYDELKDKIDKSYIVATHSGYVTYVKELATSSVALPNEVVAVISDYDDPYIICRDSNIINTDCDDYDEIYTYVDGKKVEAKEIQYSQNVKSLASINNSGLPLKFTTKDIKKYKMGQNVFIILKKTLAKDALSICMNCIKYEGTIAYVYVKNNESVERRDIELGENDGQYVEVKYGLDLDDEVHTELSNVKPSTYKDYTISTEDFFSEVKSKNINTKNTNIYGFYNKHNNVVFESIDVDFGQEVKKGDLLFTYKTDITAATIKECEQRIRSLQQNHEDALEMYSQIRENIENPPIKEENVPGIYNTDDSQSNPLNNSNDQNASPSIDSDIVPDDKKIATPNDATSSDAKKNNEGSTENNKDEKNKDEIQKPVIPERKVLYAEERKDLSLQSLDYDISLENLIYDSMLKSLQKNLDLMKENNDGNGIISVYSDRDGIVKLINPYIHLGKFYSEKQHVVSIGDDSYNEVVVEMRKIRKKNENSSYVGEVPEYPMKQAELGREISVEFNGKIYKTKSIGFSGVVNQNGVYGRAIYPVEQDGKVFIVSCTPNEGFEDQFHIDKFKEDFNYEEAFQSRADGDLMIHFNFNEFYDIPLIDAGVVYTEMFHKTELTYVWKKVGDEVVKEYVKLAPIKDEKGNNLSKYMILDGIEVGDVVIREISEDSSSGTNSEADTQTSETEINTEE